MHENTVKLDYKKILLYLDKFAQEIVKEQGTEHCYDILVVGGAAIALKHRYSRSTYDIDICMKPVARLGGFVEKVAGDNKLGNDWVNGHVMRSPSYTPLLFKKAEFYKNFQGVLNVYTISDIDLLCMKITAWRSKDIKDMKRLCKSLKRNRVSYEDVLSNFLSLYGTMYYFQVEKQCSIKSWFR